MPGFEVSGFQTLPRGDIAGLVYTVRESDTRAALHPNEQAADRRSESPTSRFVRETGLAHRIYTVRNSDRSGFGSLDTSEATALIVREPHLEEIPDDETAYRRNHGDHREARRARRLRSTRV